MSEAYRTGSFASPGAGDQVNGKGCTLQWEAALKQGRGMIA
ncbi:hypothetical protein OV208_21660 [Corallococcus sp. bb12-1]|nr:hypothetical protein [Corallococcus sp. bb12-1]MCY1043937.1 hypothetical protein [Corallococcus sp. bb12-1]